VIYSFLVLAVKI